MYAICKRFAWPATKKLFFWVMRYVDVTIPFIKKIVEK